jgi:hypothetical protein
MPITIPCLVFFEPEDFTVQAIASPAVEIILI